MYTICKRFTFESSHQLKGLPDGHPCMNLHGHSYKVDVFLRSEKLDQYGFVVDFHELKEFRDYIDTHFDHPVDSILHLTAEQLAAHFYDVLRTMFGDELIHKVRVWETEKCWAEFSEEKIIDFDRLQADMMV